MCWRSLMSYLGSETCVWPRYNQHNGPHQDLRFDNPSASYYWSKNIWWGGWMTDKLNRSFMNLLLFECFLYPHVIRSSKPKHNASIYNQLIICGCFSKLLFRWFWRKGHIFITDLLNRFFVKGVVFIYFFLFFFVCFAFDPTLKVFQT